jgi:hypothetical protein
MPALTVRTPRAGAASSGAPPASALALDAGASLDGSEFRYLAPIERSDSARRPVLAGAGAVTGTTFALRNARA